MKTFIAVKKTLVISPFFRAALGLSVTFFSFCFSLFAESEELVSFNNISASVSSDYKCQSKVDVRLDTSEEDSYRKSRVDMQKLSRIVKTYLWLDCKEIESIDFEGYAEGNDEALYRATAEKKNDWFLQEQPVDDADENNEKHVEKEESPSEIETAADDELANSTESEIPEVNAEQKENLSSPPQGKNKFSNLESLEAAAAISAEAQLELAKGLLDLPDKIDGIEFPDDTDRGIEILEKLAIDGNPDAIQLLSEAYSSDKSIDLNIPLIEALTGQPMVDGDAQRGTASAMMTLDAAAKGSELAVDALQNAGQAGSHMSYYALGMMYLLDRALKMPYEQEFLEQELDIESDVSGVGGSGNVDVGLHFLKLAAEKGNSDSQELLTDMEIEYEIPEPSNGSSSSISSLPSMLEADTDNQAQAESESEASTNTSVNSSQASSSQQSDNTTVYTEALVETGALSEVLDRRAKAEAAGTEPDATKLGSAPSQSQHAGAGNEKAASKSQSGVGSNGSEQKEATRATNRRQQANQRRGHTEYGNMNTEQNEAEIID